MYGRIYLLSLFEGVKMFRFSLLEILYILPGIFLGLSVHEFSHAMIATKLGDPTPANQGRLTLNPLKHIDPIGFIFIIIFGFGWAKPVQINHSYLKNPKKDDTLISISGPISNILVGILFVFIMKYALTLESSSIINIAYYSAYINFILAVFNILPIYPLDGFHVLSNIISLNNYRVLSTIQKYSTIILIGLLITGITRYIVGIPADFIFRTFLRMIV